MYGGTSAIATIRLRNFLDDRKKQKWRLGGTVFVVTMSGMFTFVGTYDENGTILILISVRVIPHSNFAYS